MQLRLDPTSPSGVSIVPTTPAPARSQGNGYVVNKATGLISAGSNVTLSGTGTTSDPYVINASGTGGPGGSGDMTKAVYDTGNNGIVDNAEALNGQAASYYLNRTNHTGSQAQSTITNLTTDLSARVLKAGDTMTGALNLQGSSGTMTLSASPDGGAYNIGVSATGTLAFYGAGGNTLDVELLDGKLKTTALQLTTSPTNGHVLTSDGSGNASWQAPTGSGGGGITRTIATVTTTLTGGATALTDYVYFLSTGAVFTLPTAVGNTNAYYLKNITTGNMNVSTTSGQTVDGGTLTLAPSAGVTLFSDNANWQIGA